MSHGVYRTTTSARTSIPGTGDSGVAEERGELPRDAQSPEAVQSAFNEAFSVMDLTPASAFDTGQFFLVASATA